MGYLEEGTWKESTILVYSERQTGHKENNMVILTHDRKGCLKAIYLSCLFKHSRMNLAMKV